MAETIVLDPSAVAVSRTQLDITGWIRAAGVDWGDAAITAYMAEQAVGSSPVDYRLPNRTVTIPLTLKDLGAVSYATIVTELQHKVALLQREGGWLMRQVDSIPLYADVVNATLHLGGSWLQAYKSADVDAVLTLECIPDWYGDEVTLDTVTASVGKAVAVLKLNGSNAVIAGGYPGRCRIIVTDTSGHDQNGLLWGLRSRYYDSASTAALVYEAEDLTPVGSAAVSLGQVQITNLPAGNWAPMLFTGAMTHVGTYGVWARVDSATGTPSFRLQWGVGSLSNPETNDPVALPSGGGFSLVYLGQVRIDPAPVGTNSWYGLVQAYSTPGGDSAAIDRLFFQPLDEGAGRLVYASPVAAPPATAIASGGFNPGTGADDSAVGTVAWTNPGNVTAEDGQYASAVLGAGVTSHNSKMTNFGFAIPAGATIVGITTIFKRWISGTGNVAITDNRVRLVKAGTIQATDRAAGAQWPKSLGWSSWFGGWSDLWGGTWTPADINNSGFGVTLSAVNSSGRSGTAYIDTAQIQVFYTLGAGFTVGADAVVYASQTTEVRWDGAYRAASGIYGPVSQNIGDLPRLPPSGLEARPVELLVKPSRGDLATLADSALDGFTTVVKYRPSYLYKP